MSGHDWLATKLSWPIQVSGWFSFSSNIQIEIDFMLYWSGIMLLLWWNLIPVYVNALFVTLTSIKKSMDVYFTIFLYIFPYHIKLSTRTRNPKSRKSWCHQNKAGSTADNFLFLHSSLSNSSNIRIYRLLDVLHFFLSKSVYHQYWLQRLVFMYLNKFIHIFPTLVELAELSRPVVFIDPQFLHSLTWK